MTTGVDTHFDDSGCGELGVLDERVDDRRQEQGLLPRQGEHSLWRHCSPANDETGRNVFLCVCVCLSVAPLCDHVTSSNGDPALSFSPQIIGRSVSRGPSADASRRGERKDPDCAFRLHLQHGPPLLLNGVRV